MTPLSEFIIRTVEAKGPIKGVDLSVEVATHQHDVSPQEIADALDDLVEGGDLIEVEYILKKMDYRCKSMYFPKGTKVHAREPMRDSDSES